MGNEITQLDNTKKLVMRMEGQFGSALPKQIASKKFVRTVLTAISDPAIAEQITKGTLEQNSLFSACTKAASDGLLLDGREAALLTFWSNKEKKHMAQYIPMVAGLMKKARNTGEITSITAKVVYEGDDFEQYVDENGEHFMYKPCTDSGSRGKPERVFALGLTKDGGRQLEVLERADIDSIANHSKNSKQYNPESPWFGEWWKKAAIRRLCKYLPSSSELDRLWEHDNDNFDDLGDGLGNGEPHEQVVRPAPTATQTSQAMAKARQEKEEAEAAEGDVVDAEFTEVDDAPPPAEEGDPGSDDDIPI